MIQVDVGRGLSLLLRVLATRLRMQAPPSRSAWSAQREDARREAVARRRRLLLQGQTVRRTLWLRTMWQRVGRLLGHWHSTDSPLTLGVVPSYMTRNRCQAVHCR
jgi:hypothetical protein